MMRGQWSSKDEARAAMNMKNGKVWKWKYEVVQERWLWCFLPNNLVFF